MLVLVHISGVLAEPAPSAAVQIGEIAGEIRRNAWRSLIGLPSPPPPVTETATSGGMALVGAMIGVIALVLAAISGVRREGWRLATYGASLGVAAILCHILWWVALLIVGAMLLTAIIENMGEIFGL
ncbi:hypothetical protein KDD17_02375 [Sulfitobacter albidus]|uniref:Uncharacterized protein n=1 Tax=Sulfitobacter albidus TaxID=2829501 RepID=A0A975JEB7_9RHOB|nr:hypothetical protein [Sulfitobacter albidus]QUJ76927.1 hypothetical protein KDD17_02375 [Sulfitobacter albidus]